MVNTREIAEEYRLSHWAQIMQERSASGMSVRGYCKSIGLHENVYYYWQRKLRIAAIETVEPSDLSVPSGWAICETRQETRNPQDCIQIEIGKSRITADANTDHKLLAKVCRTLMTLC